MYVNRSSTSVGWRVSLKVGSSSRKRTSSSVCTELSVRTHGSAPLRHFIELELRKSLVILEKKFPPFLSGVFGFSFVSNPCTTYFPLYQFHWSRASVARQFFTAGNFPVGSNSIFHRNTMSLNHLSSWKSSIISGRSPVMRRAASLRADYTPRQRPTCSINELSPSEHAMLQSNWKIT